MKKLFILSLIMIILIPASAMAADDYTLLEPLPCIEGTGNNCVTGSTTPTMNLEQYLGYIFKFAIAISAFLAVIMIIYGGFEIMLSEALPSKLDGKSKINNALIGLLMVLSSYLILRTIDPRLVEINTKIPQIDIKTQEVESFQSQLAKDLNDLSVESRTKVSALITEIEGIRGEINNANIILNDPNISDEEKETYRARRDELTLKYNEKNSESIKTSFVGKASKTFLDTINNKDAIVLTYRTAADKINEETALRVTALKKFGDFEGAQKIQAQERFLTEQLEKEGIITGSILSGDRVAKQQMLPEELRIAKSQYNEMNNSLMNPTPAIEKIKEDTVLAPLYTEMLKNRIDKIEAALKK